MSTRIGRQAVVVGAGMSGLTVARSLADRFEHVLVLERDSLPADATHRMGTPQGRHLHGLLGGGQRALADLFPSFEQDLARAGAVSNRVGLDLRVERPGYDPFPQRDLGWLGYSMSRPLIELTARRRVEQHANITLRERSRAQGFVATHDGATVTGVRCESVDGKKETLLADLSSTPQGVVRSPWICSSPSADRCRRRPSSASTSPIPQLFSPYLTGRRLIGKV
jgi:2-polyprenyl-6-methoxyphenol hydroxylase-like FAD-dependent oxidoreductase